MFRQGLHQVIVNGPQDLLPRLSELKMPVLILHGKQDALIPMQVAKMFHENIAISDLAVIDEAGHMSMMEKPEETARVLYSHFLSNTD